MPRRNRVDPWGDLHAVAVRGMFTGNRGCLVDDSRHLVRHHVGSLWITCVTEFRGRRHAIDQPRRWTPLFFLDDAVALAAGHRPCGECRRADYVSYRDAVTAARETADPVSAAGLNRLLAAERLVPGRGLERAGTRILWSSPLRDLPDGTVVVDGAPHPHLVTADGVRAFGFTGWGAAQPLPVDTVVDVLTPPTSVAAMRHGFRPRVHESASRPHTSEAASVHHTWS